MTTITASSIPTSSNPWQSLRQESRREIMNTDILCEIATLPEHTLQATNDLHHAFEMFRSFESRYSRFRENNELWNFNQNHSTKLSTEFFDILSCAKYFHRLTNGRFDPSILNALSREGYQGAAYDQDTASTPLPFESLVLDPTSKLATKPHSLYIDLGGIGKGYIVDQVAAFLGKHHNNFLVDAGGDIYARGGNCTEGYNYWAVEVEHPFPNHEPAALLLLTDMAVATSGRNRRTWLKNGTMKHHLIDPTTGESATTDLMTATVIAPSTVAADIWAKTLCIIGKQAAMSLAKQLHLAALFIDHHGAVTTTPLFQNYVWKAH